MCKMRKILKKKQTHCISGINTSGKRIPLRDIRVNIENLNPEKIIHSQSKSINHSNNTRKEDKVCNYIITFI